MKFVRVLLVPALLCTMILRYVLDATTDIRKILKKPVNMS